MKAEISRDKYRNETKDFSFTTLYLINEHVINECDIILHSLYKDVNDT